jgi:hypothetical protein
MGAGNSAIISDLEGNSLPCGLLAPMTKAAILPAGENYSSSSCVPDVFLTGILWAACITGVNPI